MAVLLALLLAMAWSAWAVPDLAAQAGAQAEAKEAAAQGTAIGDFELYARIHQRLAEGEDYYAAALSEQRVNNYPTVPFFTVRLPTLAHAQALLTPQGLRWLGLALLAACALSFWGRLESYSPPMERIGAMLLVVIGGAGLAADQAPFVHELFAGLLLTLALSLHRPDRWWPCVLAAALALAVRELALPFALLGLAFAVQARRWGEVAAWSGVIGLFALGLYAHYLGVSAEALPGDGVSPGWSGLVGPALPLLALARLTALLALPLWLAGPVAILALVGWAGLGGRLAAFAALWFAGFFLAMALFARAENFYWVMLALPAYLAGFAFVPRAIADLLASLRGSAVRRT